MLRLPHVSKLVNIIFPYTNGSFDPPIPITMMEMETLQAQRVFIVLTLDLGQQQDSQTLKLFQEVHYFMPQPRLWCLRKSTGRFRR